MNEKKSQKRIIDPITHTKAVEWENKIKQLVEDNRVIEARKVLSEATKTGPLSVMLTNWQRVLDQPKVLVRNYATGVYLNKEAKWVQKNAEQFKGKWVALKGGILIDSHDSLISLRQSLENSGKLTEAIVIKIEE